MNKQQAGSKGGRATLARYGREHMQKIGTKGAQVTWTRYRLMPYGLTEYAMTERKTGKVISVRGR